jgi:hypothetical protein
MAVRRHVSGYNAFFVRFGHGVYMQWTECGAKSATACIYWSVFHFKYDVELIAVGYLGRIAAP